MNMNIVWNWFRKILRGERYYTVVLRTKETASFLKFSEFKWYADPLAFHYDGKWYVFMEVFHKKLGRGCIGISKINTNKTLTSPQVIIKEKWHMSFPFCFEYDNSVYMIPETSECGKLWLYKCIEFPLKWKKVDFVDNRKYQVDSMVISINDKLYLISSDIKKDNPYVTKEKIELLNIRNDKIVLTEADLCLSSIKNYDYSSRNGGLFKVGSQYKRVVQKSKQGVYGESCEIRNIDIKDRILEESLDREITISKIFENMYHLPHLRKKKDLIGVHTYEVLDGIELFDVSFWHFSLIELFFRVRDKIKSTRKRN